jgi:tRNA (cmo5U34)-methyltransferase
MAEIEWDPETYLATMAAEIHDFAELQEAVAAATAGRNVRDVLELGVGTGETARRVRELHPGASWTAVDASEPMLARAREALPGADLRVSRLQDPLPEGRFDLVVSNLVVHHLDGPGKRDLFRRVASVLRHGGQFVLGDVVVPERPEDALVEIDWVIDLPDRLDDQLEWLREAGLEPELVWQRADLAVIRATRA